MEDRWKREARKREEARERIKQTVAQFKPKSSSMGKFQQKVIDLFSEVLKDKDMKGWSVLQSLAAAFCGNYYALNIFGNLEKGEMLEQTFVNHRQEEAGIYFLEAICLPQARRTNSKAIDMIVKWLIEYDKTDVEKKAEEILVLLGTGGLSEFVLASIFKSLKDKPELIYVICKIDQDQAFVMAKRWFSQKDKYRRDITINLLTEMKLEKHQLVWFFENVKFWQDKHLREDVCRRENYYKLVTAGYKAKAIRRDFALKCLKPAYKHAAPRDISGLCQTIQVVAPQQLGSIFYQGFIIMGKERNSFRFYDDQVKEFLTKLDSASQFSFLRSIMLTADDTDFAWFAAKEIIKTATLDQEKEVEEIFSQALGQKEKTSTLCQFLLRRKESKHDFSKEIKDKFPQLIDEVFKLLVVKKR